MLGLIGGPKILSNPEELCALKKQQENRVNLNRTVIIEFKAMQ